MSARTAGRTLVILLLLAVGIPRTASAVALTDPGPSPEALAAKKRAAIGKASKQVQLNIEQSADCLAKTVRDELVAWTNLRPSIEDKDGEAECALLQDTLLQIYLSHGMLLLPFEQEHPVAVAYAKGKLPSGLYLSEADGSYLAGKHAHYLIVPRLDLKPSRHAVMAEVYDLTKGQRALSFTISVPLSKEYADPDIIGCQVLPARNLKILTYAISHLDIQVDRGECWDLPAHVINGDGGHVASYTFGAEVPWEEAKPGDVITFGTDGATGGHVMVLLRWNKDRSTALILHQNYNGIRRVGMATLGPIETGKSGQKLAIWRP